VQRSAQSLATREDDGTTRGDEIPKIKKNKPEFFWQERSEDVETNKQIRREPLFN